jgi:hypothetical protein
MRDGTARLACGGVYGQGHHGQASCTLVDRVEAQQGSTASQMLLHLIRKLCAPAQPEKPQSATRACERRLASSAGPRQALMRQASRCARAWSVTSTPSSPHPRTRHLRPRRARCGQPLAASDGTADEGKDASEGKELLVQHCCVPA